MVRLFILSFLAAVPLFLSAQPNGYNGLWDHGKPADIHAIAFRFNNFVLTAPDSAVWIGLSGIFNLGTGIIKYKDSTWTIFDHTNSDFPDAASLSMEFDANDVIWIGTAEGLVKYDDTNWTIFNTANSPLTSDSIYALKLINSSLWIGTNNGLFSYNGTTWQSFNTSNSGIAGNSVRAIDSAGGNLWVGTTSGLSQFSGWSWTTYTTDNSNLHKDSIEIGSLGIS